MPIRMAERERLPRAWLRRDYAKMPADRMLLDDEPFDKLMERCPLERCALIKLRANGTRAWHR